MHNLVMREWQHVSLIIKIHHGECQLVILVASAKRQSPEEIQCVIHPTHIPFVVKSQSAVSDFLGGSLVVRGILGAENT